MAAFIRVAILLAYMAFLRILNIAPKSPNEYDILRDIRRGDVTVTQYGIKIFIRWTKLLQKYNQTATIPLFSIPLKNFQILKSKLFSEGFRSSIILLYII
jgi:hypothetical protein